MAVVFSQKSRDSLRSRCIGLSESRLRCAAAGTGPLGEGAYPTSAVGGSAPPTCRGESAPGRRSSERRRTARILSTCGAGPVCAEARMHEVRGMAPERPATGVFVIIHPFSFSPSPPSRPPPSAAPRAPARRLAPAPGCDDILRRRLRSFHPRPACDSSIGASRGAETRETSRGASGVRLRTHPLNLIRLVPA